LIVQNKKKHRENFLFARKESLPGPFLRKAVIAEVKSIDFSSAKEDFTALFTINGGFPKFSPKKLKNPKKRAIYDSVETRKS